jgi:predicted GIY-YIG superfamily endonuclease
VHYVYILRCADNTLYIGQTAHLKQRLASHMEGTACAFTARRRPITAAYAEEHSTKEAALHRERQLKRWTRAKQEALIEGDWQVLKRL